MSLTQQCNLVATKKTPRIGIHGVFSFPVSGTQLNF
jgi:hypothetical protein